MQNSGKWFQFFTLSMKGWVYWVLSNNHLNSLQSTECSVWTVKYSFSWFSFHHHNHHLHHSHLKQVLHHQWHHDHGLHLCWPRPRASAEGCALGSSEKSSRILRKVETEFEDGRGNFRKVEKSWETLRKFHLMHQQQDVPWAAEVSLQESFSTHTPFPQIQYVQFLTFQCANLCPYFQKCL